MQNDDFKPSSIDEVKAMEEMKNKTKTDGTLRHIVIGCLIFFAVSWLIKAAAPNLGLVIDDNADTLMSGIFDLAKIAFGCLIGQRVNKE